MTRQIIARSDEGCLQAATPRTWHTSHAVARFSASRLARAARLPASNSAGIFAERSVSKTWLFVYEYSTRTTLYQTKTTAVVVGRAECQRNLALVLFELRRIARTELRAPLTNRLIGNHNPALGKHIFDVAEA